MNGTILKDWLEGKISYDEILEKGNEIDQETLFEIKEIIESTQMLKVPEGKGKQAIWDAIDNEMPQKAEERKSDAKVISLRNAQWTIGIAASLFIVASMYFVLFKKENITTINGQYLTHTLPDDSKITINAGSILEVNHSILGNERKVNLEGEAFFEVTKGSTFVVATELGEIKVLGTSFNVLRRGSDFEVTCYSGKVQVNAAKQRAVIESNESVKLIDNQLITSKHDGKTDNSWLNGNFYFKEVSFNKVIQELQRQFDIELEIDMIKEDTYTGYFSNKDLKEALQLTLGTMGYTYTIKGKKIEVR